MLRFFEIEDRMTGRHYTHSNPKRDLLIKVYFKDFRRNGEFEIVKHNLELSGFNLFMVDNTNKYGYLHSAGQMLPTPKQIDIIRANTIDYEVYFEETLKYLGYDVIPNCL